MKLHVKAHLTACPSSWKGRDQDGRGVYVRYRWGRLSVAGMRGPAFTVLFEVVLGGEFDGEMTDDVMIAELAKQGIDVVVEGKR